MKHRNLALVIVLLAWTTPAPAQLPDGVTGADAGNVGNITEMIRRLGEGEHYGTVAFSQRSASHPIDDLLLLIESPDVDVRQLGYALLTWKGIDTIESTVREKVIDILSDGLVDPDDNVSLDNFRRLQNFSREDISFDVKRRLAHKLRNSPWSTPGHVIGYMRTAAKLGLTELLNDIRAFSQAEKIEVLQMSWHATLAAAELGDDEAMNAILAHDFQSDSASKQIKFFQSLHLVKRPEIAEFLIEKLQDDSTVTLESFDMPKITVAILASHALDNLLVGHPYPDHGQRITKEHLDEVRDWANGLEHYQFR